jgi:hypothetical protein
MIINIIVVLIVIFLLVAGGKTVRDIIRQGYLIIPFLLCSAALIGQQDTTFRKQAAKVDLLAATLEPPTHDIPGHFEFVSPQFIEVAEYDTIFKQEAEIFVNESEFYLITGTDTLSRRVCNFQYNYIELKLSCGDWIKPVRDVDGFVYALWYAEGDKRYYFSTKWRNSK